MAKVMNECFNSVFIAENISSLQFPATKLEGDKTDNLGQLFVTPEW